MPGRVVRAVGGGKRTRIGLSFDEYGELGLTPLAEADPAFVQAGEMERESLFPMTINQLAEHVRCGVRPQPPDAATARGEAGGTAVVAGCVDRGADKHLGGRDAFGDAAVQ